MLTLIINFSLLSIALGLILCLLLTAPKRRTKPSYTNLKPVGKGISLPHSLWEIIQEKAEHLGEEHTVSSVVRNMIEKSI